MFSHWKPSGNIGLSTQALETVGRREFFGTIELNVLNQFMKEKYHSNVKFAITLAASVYEGKKPHD